MLNRLKKKLLGQHGSKNSTAASDIEETKGEHVQQQKDPRYRPINFSMSKVSFEMLRKKRAFVSTNEHSLTPVMPAQPTDGTQPTYEGFAHLGDVLPIYPIAAQAVDATHPTQLISDEVSGVQQTLSNDVLDDEARLAFQEKYKLLESREVGREDNKNGSSVVKSVAIIYNPNSGKKINLIPQIERKLKTAGVPFEVYYTQQYLDTYNFAKTIDLSKHSILAVCGGDGSSHEVVNGMLDRPDKVKIPLAFLPNGSGNDLCIALGITNLDRALLYIIKGHCIKMDTVRVLVDHDSEDTLPEGNDRLNYSRHLVNASGVGVQPKVARTARPYKNCCGNRSYEFAILYEACYMKADEYELTIDGKRVEQVEGGRIQTSNLIVSNTPFTGGGMVINPFALINDGLIDVTWFSDPALDCLSGVVGFARDSKKYKGIQAYTGQHSYMRGRKIKLVYRGRAGQTQPTRQLQLLLVDGEDLRFEHQVTWENQHNNIEVMFDPSFYFREYNCFVGRFDGRAVHERAQIETVIKQVFADFEIDKEGKLTVDVVREVVQAILNEDWWDEMDFHDSVLEMLRQDGKGFIEAADFYNLFLGQ